MTKLRPVEFKWRQFEPQLILMAVGWYLRFSLSYRDVEELLQERGILADHVTVWRWVQRYARMVKKLDLAENRRYRQAGFEGTGPTLADVRR